VRGGLRLSGIFICGRAYNNIIGYVGSMGQFPNFRGITARYAFGSLLPQGDRLRAFQHIGEAIGGAGVAVRIWLYARFLYLKRGVRLPFGPIAISGPASLYWPAQ
jgi:hypothetical protein